MLKNSLCTEIRQLFSIFHPSERAGHFLATAELDEMLFYCFFGGRKTRDIRFDGGQRFQEVGIQEDLLLELHTTLTYTFHLPFVFGRW